MAFGVTQIHRILTQERKIRVFLLAAAAMPVLTAFLIYSAQPALYVLSALYGLLAVFLFSDVLFTRVKTGATAFSQDVMNYHEIFALLPAAVYTTDAAGRLTFYNEAAADLWGRRPVIGQDEWCGSWRIYTPDGQRLPLDQCPMAVALKENRSVRGVQAIVERPDGVKIPFMPYPTPIRDKNGKLVGAMNVLMRLQ